ncbi:Protein SRG1 [Acorus gramineus]|uniref:Protein SRG1 n=1 Tax=Acorus gramineus TaxID=55184 RepID=A0AAV9ALN6_ACOGR|nr:Protein SRG1 [Acorus gramineus]
MDCLKDWPEPVISVETLTGLLTIPERYIKPPSQRPNITTTSSNLNIPTIDLAALRQGLDDHEAMEGIRKACREWGFFILVNHGVEPELMRAMRGVWRRFFYLPLKDKKRYANSPATYEGFGSRLGVEKGAILDWGDYFFLHILPPCMKNHEKWPALPTSCREITEEYSKELIKLCGFLMKVFSRNLGLGEERLQEAFGGEEVGVCLRVNYYPKCPQPDLTLGLSPHSDPGGLTLLHVDDHVEGLQVLKDSEWITVKPAPDSFIVNIADQLQILSNGIYKSVEHRVIVNSSQDRISLAFFYNPKSDIPISPFGELVTPPERPVMYQQMTFDEYRLSIRKRGLKGKSLVEAIKPT